MHYELQKGIHYKGLGVKLGPFRINKTEKLVYFWSRTVITRAQ